jgi:cobalamin biosynthesis protein CbiG
MSTFHLQHHAQQKRWLPDDPLALDIIAKMLLQAQPVTIVQQAGSKLTALPEMVTLLDQLPADPDPTVPLVIITDRLLGPKPDVDRLVILRPPTLALGVATRRELSFDDFSEAVRQLTRKSGYSQQSIHAIAASSRRRLLGWLDDFADKLQVPMLFYDDRILTRSPLPTPGKMAGTCAVSAILAAGVREPLVNSTPFFGKMTLALARRADTV